MTWNLEEDSKLKWICALWVPWRSLPKRERERERTEHITNHNRKEKKCMHEKCISM